MHRGIIRAAIATTLLLIFTCNADAIDFDDPLGIKKAAKDAAEAAVHGADISTRNLAMMTNQFGQLIDDFYGGDAAKMNKARKVLEGVFGRSLTSADNVKLQVTAAFEGNVVPADRLEADLWLFPNIDNDALKRIAAAGASFLGTPIKSAVPSGTTLQAVRANVLAKAQTFGARGGSVYGIPKTRAGECHAKFPLRISASWQPIPRSAEEQRQYDACVAEKEALELTEVVMASFSAGDSLTTQGTVTRDLPGGRFVAVVANKQAVERLRDGLKITFWVHQMGEPQKRIGAFREVVRRIEPADMLKNVAPTPLQATPELCYIFVDLKLDAIMGSAYLTTAGK
jgi:hypothetical protein